MAIDSEAKRKSVAAIGSLYVGPVVVPDGSLALFDRQVVGYGYGGIEVGEAATANCVCANSVSLGSSQAVVSLGVPGVSVALEC